MTTSEFSLPRAIRLLIIMLELVIVVSVGMRAAQYPVLTPSRVTMQSVLTNLIFVSLLLLVLIEVVCFTAASTGFVQPRETVWVRSGVGRNCSRQSARMNREGLTMRWSAPRTVLRFTSR